MYLYGVFIVLVTTGGGFSRSAVISDVIRIDTDTSDIFAEEILRWASGAESQNFRRIVQELVLPREWQRENWAKYDALKSSVMCTICKSLSTAVLTMHRRGTPAEAIEHTVANLCELLHIQTRNVCQGVVRLNSPIIIHIIDNDPTISHNDICGLILQNQRCGPPPSRYNWTINIDNNQPRIPDIQASNDSVKILQLTDIHYDPLYEPGGNANCDEPTCCRRGQNNTKNSRSAGFWGDYNYCDVPWHAVLDYLDEVKTRHKDADFIYFTGDVIDHGVWETSHSMNHKSLIKIFKKLKETFQDRPVYPILGNHEPHPLNQFSPDNIEEDSLSTKWLYRLLADIWIDAGWLPEATRETIIRGGFYTVSPKKGFRIIAVNNNVAYIYNWWLLYKPIDLNGQLKWLADTLLDAEKASEMVHILAHVPGGSQDFQRTWSREYRKIVNRFSHIITAQFNGHTHTDEFNVFYHPDNRSKIINVSWNGGSLSAYANLNPNYRVYRAHASTYEVQEAVTWLYNLTEANLSPNRRPNWYQQYSFTEEYGLQDLSKESLHKLIIDMAEGGKQLETYHKNFYKLAEPELRTKCDRKCLQKHICTIVTSSSDDESQCRHLEQQTNANKQFRLSDLGPLSPLG